jgi:14-3-3 protein epsilon
MGDYSESIFLSRVAEQADRFEDMFKHLKGAIKLKNDDFSADERNLLSVGFKNLIGSRRTALRNISAIAQNPKYAHFQEALEKYRTKIQNELYQQCVDITGTIENNILPNCDKKAESKCFFYKMIADYYRYIAESAKGEKLQEVSDSALEYYEKAMEEGNSLKSYSPTKLGLALNFSVFYFEVRDNKDEAIKLAEKALSEANDGIDDADQEIYRDAKGIIDLLSENLELWKEEGDGNDD